ncbi:MAG TPA: hypothetical protein VKJ07_11950, partial [Mycobacteriales bacterium]|nr:hypothetical protein [Mycobacteriales bacterium]
MVALVAAVIVISRSDRSHARLSAPTPARTLHGKRSAEKPGPAKAATASTASTASTTVAPRNGPPWSVGRATLVFYDASRGSPARGVYPGHAGRALYTTLRWPVSPQGHIAPGT